MLRRLIPYLTALFLMGNGFIHPNLSHCQNTQVYTLAVLDLEANGISTAEAKGLSEKMRSRISWVVKSDSYSKASNTDKYEIVERTQMDKIFDQFNIQNTECISDSCAITFGKMLQVDRIVIGAASLLGKTYSITCRMIDVESGKTLHVSEKGYGGSIDGVVVSVVPLVSDELILGATYDDWLNSEWISIRGSPDTATVHIGRESLGRTPLARKIIQVGSHSIRIRKSGFEDYKEKIWVEKGKPVNLTYVLEPKTKTRAVLKSLIIPGRGQWYAEHQVKGTFLFLFQTTALAGTAWSTYSYLMALDDYDDAKTAYNNAVTPTDIENTRNKMVDTHDKAKSLHTLHIATIGMAAGVYLWNAFVIMLTNPRDDHETSNSHVDFTPFSRVGFSGVRMNIRF